MSDDRQAGVRSVRNHAGLLLRAVLNVYPGDNGAGGVKRIGERNVKTGAAINKAVRDLRLFCLIRR